MSNDYQRQLGVRLREIRRQQGYTLQQVEERSGGQWKAVVVGSYERGDRAISVAKLADLASFYGVPVTELLPPHDGATPSPTTRTDGGPDVVIDLAALEHADRSETTLRPLTRYVRTIQVQRGDYNGRMLTLRAADLKALAIVLGIEGDELLAALEARGLILRR